MSLDELHRRITAGLQEKADQSIRRANNIRPRAASAGVQNGVPYTVPATTADEIALTAVEALAETRAYLDAVKTVTDIYRQIVQPQSVTNVEELDPKTRKRVY